jgi:hypothetical protein
MMSTSSQHQQNNLVTLRMVKPASSASTKGLLANNDHQEEVPSKLKNASDDNTNLDIDNVVKTSVHKPVLLLSDLQKHTLSRILSVCPRPSKTVIDMISKQMDLSSDVINSFFTTNTTTTNYDTLQIHSSLKASTAQQRLCF